MKAYIPLAKKLPKPIRNTAIDIFAPKIVKAAKSNKKLKWLTYFVTNYCNAKCEHCFYWDELNNKAPEMSNEQITSVLTSLGSKLYTLRLSGGEPFLKKDRLIHIFGLLNEKKIADKLTIPTHGMLEIIPTIEKMLEFQDGVHFNVSVSLDGLEKRHNETRKIKNGFKKAIENLRYLVDLQKKNKNFSITCCLSLSRQVVFPKTGELFSEVEQLIRFLREDVGITTIGYDHIRSAATDVELLPKKINSNFAPPPLVDDDPDNRHKRTGSVQLDIDEMEQVNQALINFEGDNIDQRTIKRLEKQVQIKRTKSRVVDCMAGYVDAVMYPGGDVALCEFSNSFANLESYNFNFYELWHSDKAEEFRRLINKCSCTHPCHLSDSMVYNKEFLKDYFQSV